jgi:hypothetical protein
MPAARRFLSAFVPAVLLTAATLGSVPVTLPSIVVSDGHARLAVGEIRLSAWSAALAQTPGQATLRDVTLTLGSQTYRAERIDFSGLESSETDLRALLSDGSTASVPSRLSSISARRIVIPELVSEYETGALRQRTVYTNVRASDVVEGRAREVTVESATAQTAGPQTETSQSQGRSRITELDLAQTARLFAERAETRDGPRTKIYETLVADDLTLADRNGSTTRIARVEVRDVSARPTEDSWSGTLSLVGAMLEMDKPSGEDTARLLAAAADLVSAFEIGSAEATGIAFAAPRGTSTGTVRRLSFSGARDGGSGEARIEGLSVVQPDTGRFTIDAIALREISLHSSLAGLRALRGRSVDNLDPAELRTIVPSIGTMQVTGLNADLPNAEAKVPSADRIRFALGNLEIAARDPVHGIPTDLRLAVEHLTFPLPAGDANRNVQFIRGLGYEALDLSFSTSLAWNRRTHDLTVRELSVAGEDMGNVRLGSVLGNVTPDIMISVDPAATLKAWSDVRIKSFGLSIEDAGLVDRLLEREARLRDRQPDSLRREYMSAVSSALPILLGGSAEAKDIGRAVAAFLAKPSRLVVSARAESPGGLSLVELAAMSDPAALLDKLSVTATAEERL